MSEENNNNSPRVNQSGNNQDLNDLFILASAAAAAPLRSLNLLDYLYANSVPLYYGGAGAGAGGGGGDAVDAVASILARSLYDRCPVKKVITEEAQHDIIDKKFAAAMVEELKINDACGIWQEPFEEGEDIKILPCNHAFKADAILKWLHEEKAECPICRFSLESKEVIEDQHNSLHPLSEHQHEDQHHDANAPESESDIVRVNNIASRLAESVAGNANPNFHREHHQQHHRAISIPMNQLLQSMRLMSSSSRPREHVRAAVPSSGGAAAPVSQSSYASVGHEVRAEAVQHGGSRLNNGNAPANNYIYINNYDIINNYNNNYNNNNNNNNRDEDNEAADDAENILMMNQEEADIQEAIRRSLA
jgi:hypothetical protein